LGTCLEGFQAFLHPLRPEAGPLVRAAEVHVPFSFTQMTFRHWKWWSNVIGGDRSIQQLIVADSRSELGGKVDHAHSHILLLSNMGTSAPWSGAIIADPSKAPATVI
jgi:hypothetical protein